jgi:hypothetical protein
MHQVIRVDTDTNTLYVSAVTSQSEGTNVSVGTAASNFAVHGMSLMRNMIILEYVWRDVLGRMGSLVELSVETATTDGKLSIFLLHFRGDVY